MDYIEIEKDLIPYRFEMDLPDEYEFEIGYNARFDFFTVDLYKEGNALVVGEKLILDRPLFEDLASVDLPKVKIIPMDRVGEENRITYENLERTVFLYVIDGDDDGSI